MLPFSVSNYPSTVSQEQLYGFWTTFFVHSTEITVSFGTDRNKLWSPGKDRVVCYYRATSHWFTFANSELHQPMRSICVIIFLFLMLPVTRAADINVKTLENGSTLIVIEGRFDLSDVETFRTKIEPLPAAKATIAFRSKGGRLLAGIRIGTLIRAKKFTTVVPDGASCASACALAWLGGARRFMGHDSSIGFHAAFIFKSDVPTESGPGNAILGAYLNQLGLSEKAILYVTQAAPTSMQWMSLQDAAEHGIAVALLPPPHSASGPNAVVFAEQVEESPERRASDFVRSLVAKWSRPGAELLPFLERVYAGKVLYYGKSTPRHVVLLSKHRIADRWTERAYIIHRGSLSASCVETGETCRVKAVVSWRYYNAKTTSRSRGVASFEYSVALDPETPQIVAETSFVHEKPSVSPGPLKKVQRDLRQWLAEISKLIQ